MKYFFIIILLKIVLFSTILKAQSTLPDAPVFLSASVLPESNPVEVVLSWSPSDSADVIGYTIYKVNGTTVKHDDVFGRSVNSYLYSPSNADQVVNTFRLASFDNEENRSRLTDPHSTILLNLQLDKCNNTVDLFWTEYIGWEHGVKEYRVLRRKEDRESYTIIKTLSSDNLNYTDSTVTNGSNYYYYIEAISNLGVRANSNSRTIYIESYTTPSYMYAQSASVIDNKIELKFLVANNGEVLQYDLKKSNYPDKSFFTITSIQNTGQNEISFIDNNVDVNNNRYYYKLVSLNPCGVISSESNISSNILLTMDEKTELHHNFSWTDYVNWKNGVSIYQIYSFFDEIETEIGINNSTELSFANSIGDYVIDAHNNQIHLTNKFCYFVEAVESHINNPTGIQGLSRSNIVCTYHDPVIWVPDAINVSSLSSKNRVFKPIISFIEEEPYELIIYDRWGFEVFRTNKTYEGWEANSIGDTGTYQRYLYYLKYYDYGGGKHIKSGSFIIINQ